MDIITMIGITAAVLTTSAFVPQAVKTWKSKSAGDLSLSMYLMRFIGIGMWLVDGFCKKDIPLILANGISFCLSFVILFFKIKEIRSGQSGVK